MMLGAVKKKLVLFIHFLTAPYAVLEAKQAQVIYLRRLSA
jgi:hypothetical protein